MIEPKVGDPADRTVLLFYKEKESDTFVPFDRYLRRPVRLIHHRLQNRPTVTGFLVWHQNLVRSLRDSRYRVLVNDYRFAKRHPEHPVGITGYPAILDNWDLPNPAILGPGLYDHPKIRPDLMFDSRFHFYLSTCDWNMQMFRSVYGNSVVPWYGAIDVDKWPSLSDYPKSIDVLVYDKIRWDRETRILDLYGPIIDALKSRGLTYKSVRYGSYDYRSFRALLKRSRSLLFLCEHETQGMAYQEALSSNLPVLAWDQGRWLDPQRPRFSPEPVPASSVPYFDATCGLRFANASEFRVAFEEFWNRLPEFRPREYVLRNLSPAGSAKLYADYYFSLVQGAPEARRRVEVGNGPTL